MVPFIWIGFGTGSAIELRHLRYFIAVAEELHFTRAAQRLGIGQPPLSQQIRDLERDLGTALFDRRTRAVTLTAAGRVFLHELRAILAAAAQAKIGAFQAERGQTGMLRVGFTGSAAFNPRVPTTIRLYRRAYEDVVLTLREANSQQLLSELKHNALDVVFLRGASTAPKTLTTTDLGAEPLIAAVPVTARRVSRRPIALASLAAEPFVMFPRENGPDVYDTIQAACRRAGFDPIPGQEAPQLTSIINLVAAGMGVSLVPESMAQVRVTGVGYRHLTDAPSLVRLMLARRTDDPSETAARFVDIATDGAARLGLTHGRAVAPVPTERRAAQELRMRDNR